MKVSLERKILLGFAAVALALLGAATTIWWTAANFSASFRMVDHTHDVLYSLEETLTKLLVIQSTSRSFALTGSEDLLSSYDRDEAAVLEAQTRVRRLLADNPAQLHRFNQLDPLIAQVTTLLRERIMLRRTLGLEAAAQARVNVTGRQMMDVVRDLIGELEGEERRLLAERSARAQRDFAITVVVVVIGCTVSLLGITGAVFVVRRDLQLRQRAEAALRASEARYRMLFSSLDEGFCVIEMIFDERERPIDYRFLETSPSFEKQTGLRDVVGRRMRELAPLHEAHWFETYGRIAVTGEPARFQNRAAQLHRWYDVYAFRIGPPNERQVAILFNDITERKRTEAALNDRTTQLEAANQELEAFSYSVSHDLRAPLRHIHGFASLFEKHSPTLDERGRRYLATIRDAARQMGVLIDDLLAFSRTSRTQLVPANVAHDALLADVIRAGRYETPGRTVVWEISPLPSVRADAAMLRQVWANLLDNAVKYSAKSPHPRIRIHGEADAAKGENVFSVSDNGVGFDMAYAGKLFGVFQRLHGPTEFEGTGIGLANVRRIIARHGGRTWAEGRVGEGATFYFSLPIVTSPPHESRSP